MDTMILDFKLSSSSDSFRETLSTKSHATLSALLIQLCNNACNVLTFQVCNFQKAVKIHLLEVVILRDDATDESEKCVAGIDHVVRNYDQTDFVIQFIHVFGTLVQIYDAAVCIPHLGVYLVK